MADDKTLFEDFTSHSKEEWEAKVLVDLKGKALASLNFEIEEGIVMSPIFHPSDVSEFRTSNLLNYRNGPWQIGASFDGSDPVATNSMLKVDLEGGVNAPLLIFDKKMDLPAISKLYDGIEPTWVTNHFESTADEFLEVFFDHWVVYLQKEGKDLKKISGNLGLSTVANTSIKGQEILAFAKKEMPTFSIFRIVETAGQNYSTGLASLMTQAAELLDQAQGDAAQMAQQIQFRIWVDKNYFASIAKVRAFHILWANLLKAYECPIDLIPDISVHFAADTQSSDEYQNMISAATIAMSAVIGGGTTIFIPPASTPETALTRRMARNVNHILKMESYLDKVTDPAAGSYYIESLTNQFAEKAWIFFSKGKK